jgi:hypothetical protein
VCVMVCWGVCLCVRLRGIVQIWGFMCCQCVTRGDAGWNKDGDCRVPRELSIYCTSNLKRQYRIKMGRTSGALYILHIKVKETVQNKDGEYLGISLYIAHQS